MLSHNRFGKFHGAWALLFLPLRSRNKGSCYSLLTRFNQKRGGCLVSFLRVCTGYIGAMENKMEATIVYWGYIGIMENRMEITNYSILRLYWDNGK